MNQITNLKNVYAKFSLSILPKSFSFLTLPRHTISSFYNILIKLKQKHLGVFIIFNPSQILFQLAFLVRIKMALLMPMIVYGSSLIIILVQPKKVLQKLL